ncbi:MAG: hypothetical protein Q4F84_01430 [Fibrobacter sp.]|nr:hypothetical protein [Fibrobacter sp.]
MIRKNEHGNSIVELIISVVMLAIFVTGLNACVVNLINSNITSKEMSEATAAGHQILDRFRDIDYLNITSSSDEINGKFIRYWTVTENGIQKKIDLTVLWPIETKKHSITLSTIIAK